VADFGASREDVRFFFGDAASISQHGSALFEITRRIFPVFVYF
jgi:hypothetical protein